MDDIEDKHAVAAMVATPFAIVMRCSVPNTIIVIDTGKQK